MNLESTLRHMLLVRIINRFAKSVQVFVRDDRRAHNHLLYRCEGCGNYSHPQTFNTWAVNNWGIYYHIIPCPPRIEKEEGFNFFPPWTYAMMRSY